MRIEVRLRAGLWRVSREGGGELSSHIGLAAAAERARRVSWDERCDVIVIEDDPARRLESV